MSECGILVGLGVHNVGCCDSWLLAFFLASQTVIAVLHQEMSPIQPWPRKQGLAFGSLLSI